MDHLNLEIPEYSSKIDSTKNHEGTLEEWTIQKVYLSYIKHLYDGKCKQKRKKTEAINEVKKKDIKLE